MKTRITALMVMVAAMVFGQHMPIRSEANGKTEVSLSPYGMWPFCQAGGILPAICDGYTPGQGGEAWVLLVKGTMPGITAYSFQIVYTTKAGVRMESHGVRLKADNMYGWTEILLPIGLIQDGWKVSVQSLSPVSGGEAENRP